MSHQFGDLVKQYLSRRHGLSQNKLADGINLDPAIISRMCQGRLLTGETARERVLAVISWFQKQEVLRFQEEANALLEAAGMSGLQSGAPAEQALLKVLGRPTRTFPSGCAPPRPALLIGREAALAELKQRLKPAGSGHAPSPYPTQVITAIRGWPGVGKTTLAAALAHDPQVVRSFGDGVLWTTLGPDPNLLVKLVEWGRALGIDSIAKATGVDEAAALLAAALRDRQMLLIVDDVWEAFHAVPFMVGGRSCALLLTTRLPVVAEALAPTSADVYRLPVLTEDMSLALLSKLAPGVVGSYPELSRELANELEGLPLALQIAGHLLNVEALNGWGVRDLLDELRAGVRLLSASVPAVLVDLEEASIPTVRVLLRKSTDRLAPEMRACFASLGVFAPKPATFDLTAMGAVWQVSDPKPIARELVNRGLLEPVPNSRFQIHALLVVHAKSMLTE